MVHKRILWIDIAKTITIICMIIGHIIPSGELRNLIYSFHMPLFFMLTGFTIKKISTSKELFCQIKKDFFRILIPYLTISFTEILIGIIVFKERIPINILMDKLVWASGVEVKGHPAIGAIWFLVALFFAKLLFSIIQLLFPTTSNGILYMLAALIGHFIAIKQAWMVLSLDIVLVAVLYVYLGSLMKDYWSLIEDKQLVITIISWFIWIFYWNEGMFIEIAPRYYPRFPLCVFVSLCGCFCIFMLSKSIENQSKFAEVLGNIGKHTLAILGVHYLSFRFMYLWSNHSIIINSLIDIAVAFGGAFIFVYLKKCIITILKK